MGGAQALKLVLTSEATSVRSAKPRNLELLEVLLLHATGYVSRSFDHHMGGRTEVRRGRTDAQSFAEKLAARPARCSWMFIAL